MVLLTAFVPLEARKVMKTQPRKYERFNTYQLRLLTETFRKNPYLSKAEAKALAMRLQVSVKSIRIWFVNQRNRIRLQEGDVKGNQ